MTWEEMKQVIRDLRNTKWTDREIEETFKNCVDMSRKTYIAKQLRDSQDIIDVKTFLRRY